MGKITLKEILLVVVGAILFFNFLIIVLMFGTGYIRVNVGPDEEKKVVLKKIEGPQEIIIREPGMDSLAFLHYKQFEALQREYNILLKKQHEVGMDTTRLNILKQEVTEKQREIDNLRKSIENLVAQSNSLEMMRLKHLARIYDSMRPQEAAPIISSLPDDMIVKIMRLMKKRSVGKILGRMEQSRASEISRKLGILSPEELLKDESNAQPNQTSGL